jgi:hypothetical protein
MMTFMARVCAPMTDPDKLNDGLENAAAATI